MSDVEATVLVVDDDVAVGKVLTALLQQGGMRALHAPSAAEALQQLDSAPVDLVLTDLRMPGMDGMELVGRLRCGWPDIPVIMLTAHGTVASAVQAMKAGAADFMLKPFDREEVLFTVRRALEASQHLRAQPPRHCALPADMIGECAAMLELAELVDRAAQTSSTVLIRGESGTGKELVARAIHDQSPRRDRPFIPVHCAALPESLLESELFGYEKGAFTGAVARKPGRVELAEGGTLFLDELGEMPLAMQAKMLRLLQEKEFQRVGGTRPQRADVRFVAATHRDLEAMIRAGELREDLYYRINVLPIWLPPLRERGRDIALLARHFSTTLAAENGLSAIELEDGALRLLEQQRWPGNVRHLQNFIERLVILSDGARVTAHVVEAQLARQPELARGTDSSAAARSADLKQRLVEAERDALVDALERAKHNRSLAARLLGISRRSLYNRLEEFGIE